MRILKGPVSEPWSIECHCPNKDRQATFEISSNDLTYFLNIFMLTVLVVADLRLLLED